MANRPTRTFLVTGGLGFLGSYIVDQLLARGDRVIVFDVVLPREGTANARVTYLAGNLTNSDDVNKACKGVDAVIHVASPPHNAPGKVLLDVNVNGTQNVIDACVHNRIGVLVYTSSASVVFGGADIVNGNEELPYTRPGFDPYTDTKALGEQKVLSANNMPLPAAAKGATGSMHLKTIALRPHGIFGPRDRQQIPEIVKAARAGKTKFIIGNGKNLVDFTFADNVALAHLIAADRLFDGPSGGTDPSGKAFNITNDDPIPFWEYMGTVLEGLGYPRPSIKLPYGLIYALSAVVENAYHLAEKVTGKKTEPTFTRLRISLAGTSHYYSCERAKKELGYKPKVTVKEGLVKTLESFQQLHARNMPPVEKKSAGPRLVVVLAVLFLLVVLYKLLL